MVTAGTRLRACRIVTILVLWAATAVLPWEGQVAAAVGVFVVTAMAGAKRDQASFQLGAYSSIALVVSAATPVTLGLLPALVSLVLYGTAVRALPLLDGAGGWLRRGRLDVRIAGLIVLVSMLSAAALVLWYQVVDPDVGRFQRLVPQVSWYVLALVGVGFAALNATAEEFVYRGIVLDALERSFGAGTTALLLQAGSFASVHLHGFPSGLSGVGLSLVYGLLLGALRRRAGGMFAPWLAHFIADLTIFVMLLTLVT